MPRKLITFLGTGDYSPCRYQWGKSSSAPVKYVQLALAEHLRPERIVVFVTPSAHQKNFLGEEGLLAAASSEVAPLLTPVEIPEGKSPEEIWDIFKRVFDQVEEGDVVSFDITHSFRSIPVIGLACLQYAGTLRNMTVEGVYYGAFEARDPETNTTPIFDLTPFVQLMEWSRAVSELVKFGHCGTLGQQVRAGTTGANSKHARLLKTLAGDLEKTSVAIAGCRGKDIFRKPPWEDIPLHLRKLRRGKDPLLAAFVPLLDLIEEEVGVLKVEGVDAGLEVQRGLGAVGWCLRHDMVPQAYSILQESMITRVCEASGLDSGSKEARKLVSMCPALRKKDVEQWSKEAKDQKEKISDVWGYVEPALLDLLEDFSGWRNDVMHCKFKSDKDFQTLKKKLNRSLGQFMELLKKNE